MAMYVDYDWSIDKDKIVLDPDLDIDKLGWEHGDHFKLINVDGRAQLVKVEPIVRFVRGYR
jgi:hypothetical protein